MTLEEAIKQLKLMKVFIGIDAENPLVKKNAISRQAVLRLVEQYPSIIGNRCVGLMADIKHLPSVTPTISDIENNFNLGYNCGYLLRSDGLEDSEVVRL